MSISNVIAINAASFLCRERIRCFQVLTRPPSINLVPNRANAVSTTLLSNASASNLTILCVAGKITLYMFRYSRYCRRITLNFLYGILIYNKSIFRGYEIIRPCFVTPLFRDSTVCLFTFGKDKLMYDIRFSSVMYTITLFTRCLGYFFHGIKDGRTVTCLTFSRYNDNYVTSITRNSGVAMT